MSLEPTKCAKCPARIVWARSATTGKPMPVDAEPAANGNVRLRHLGDELVADVLGKDAEVAALAKGESLHLNHFVTCPFSRDFRKGSEK